MKILTAKQTHEVDQFTIQNEPIDSINLMERAARAFTDVFFEQVSPKNRVAVVSGRGNNGGDGLAIARLLINRHYEVKVFAIELQKDASADFKNNEERLRDLVKIQSIDSEADIPKFDEFDVIIDGLFGSGLSRPVEGLYAQVINEINNAKAEVYAIDIASGLFADQPSKEGAKVQANYTISFQLPKLGFFLPENAPYVGEWKIVNIGLHEEGIASQNTSFYYLDQDMARLVLKPRLKFDHKGSWGRVLLMAGSYGKMGAAILAGQAVMRAGAGLLTMYIPTCGYDIMQLAVPEAMVELDDGDHFLTTSPEFQTFDAVGIGPGIGKEQETIMSVIEAVRAFEKPMVLDADALNIISEHHEILEMLPAGSIITPHPREFERLVGSWGNDFERIEKQKALAREHQLIVVVKGAHTTIVTPEADVYFNSTGNPGMATGGSGDVLTGIITSLLGQGYAPREAAILGVYIHGLSGDIAATKKGCEAMIASDIVAFLPQAYLKLNS